jgi:non-ribosomal peptide synthetase component F
MIFRSFAGPVKDRVRCRVAGWPVAGGARRASRREVIVGVCARPSADFVVGVLGVLKAGGAFVALDVT